MRRSLVMAAVIIAVIAAGAVAYTQLRPRPQAQTRRVDPAVAIAAAIRVLERSEQHQLTEEQIKAILPLLKVLRDTAPNDVEPSRALAVQIQTTFTPEQRAEIERVREEAQRRRLERQAGDPGSPRPGGGPGFGPPGGAQGGPGGEFSRAEFRQRILSRLIETLEARL